MDMFLHVWCCVNCTVVIYKQGHGAVTNHQHKWENGPFLFYTSTSPIDGPCFILYKYIVQIIVYITRTILKITFEYFRQHRYQLTSNPLACVNGNIPNCKQQVEDKPFYRKSTLSDHHNHSIFDHIDIYLENNNKST